ncbi:MAG: CpsB/CapC family capsule biosynthesis tyrosine phosphatase [Candidatus Deferrimicrobium sp.]
MTIDWHSHILPGVDDGPTDIEQSVAIAVSMAAGGFTEIYCTPHLMRGCYEAGNDEVRWGVAKLQERLNASGIPIILRSGREYCLDEYLQAALDDPLPLGDSRLILVEILPHSTAGMVRRLVYDVVRAGFTPVIAHPERCHLLEPSGPPNGNGGIRGVLGHLLGGGHRNGNGHSPSDATGNLLLSYLRELGCSFQGNLGSFSGFYGGQVRRTAESMRTAGIYDRYGSDLHTLEQAKIVLSGQQKQTIDNGGRMGVCW